VDEAHGCFAAVDNRHAPKTLLHVPSCSLSRRIHASAGCMDFSGVVSTIPGSATVR
jgi:hypothetical protein